MKILSYKREYLISFEVNPDIESVSLIIFQLKTLTNCSLQRMCFEKEALKLIDTLHRKYPFFIVGS
jgi:hypothetical protein